MADESITPEVVLPPPLPPPRVVPVWRVLAVAFTIAILVMVLIGWFSLQFVETLDRTSITVTFRNANGLKVGADLRYREIKIGTVKSVTLAKNKQIQVGIDLDKGEDDFATANAVYWITYPRLNLRSGLSSLSTLFTGSYVDVDLSGINGATPGQASGRNRRSFVGLEEPPAALSDEKGDVFQLTADDLGSLDVGSPVYFHRVSIGRVAAYKLDGIAVNVSVFIQQPYLPLVTDAACFWQASGVDFTAGIDGYHVQTASVVSLIAGGIALDTDCRDSTDREAKPVPVKADHQFPLFSDRAAATPDPREPPLVVTMRFDGSARGMGVGASVDFLGVGLGKVKTVQLDYDDAHRRFPVVVQAALYPRRLGSLVMDKIPSADKQQDGRLAASAFFKTLVDAGLRAHMRSASLLTGTQYIGLDFPEKAAKAKFVAHDDGSIEIPTVSGDSLTDLAPRLNDIADKIDNLPFQQVANNLSGTLAAARSLFSTLTPEAQATLKGVRQTLDQLDHTLLTENAPMQQNLAGTLDEIRRAARSMRVMADYLQNHPDSLLRGHGTDPAVPALQPTAAK